MRLYDPKPFRRPTEPPSEGYRWQTWETLTPSQVETNRRNGRRCSFRPGRMPGCDCNLCDIPQPAEPEPPPKPPPDYSEAYATAARNAFRTGYPEYAQIAARTYYTDDKADDLALVLLTDCAYGTIRTHAVLTRLLAGNPTAAAISDIVRRNAELLEDPPPTQETYNRINESYEDGTEPDAVQAAANAIKAGFGRMI